MKAAIDRVMSRVERIPESGCWLFMGALNEAGYGIVGLGGKGNGNDRAHRITYRHFVGETPHGMVVCHRCDVPCCCNPDHLFLGTHADNHADMRRKGRHSNPPRNPHLVGSNHYAALLSEQDVRDIRTRYENGESGYKLSREYGVVDSAVYKIINRTSWKHVA